MSVEPAFDYEATTWGGGGVVAPNRPDFLDHSLHLTWALEALSDVKGHVLEVGCGSARFIASVAAARPDLITHGSDLSRAAVAEARAHHHATHMTLGSAERLPYRTASLDAVLMIDVLEHLPSMELGLAEVRRVLKPGAPFHLVFPCEAHPATLHGHSSVLRGLKRRFAGHIQQRTPVELTAALTGQGLAPFRTRSSYHVLGQLYDLAVFGAMGLGLDMHGTRRSHIEQGGGSALKWVRKLVSGALYVEARALSRLPIGMTVHVTCR